MLGVVYDMLNYTINKDKIVIVGDDEFNPKHILECGQFFRFFINDAGNYVVLTSCYYCEILKTQNGYEILSSHPKVFERLFNLKKDYSLIKEKLKVDPVIKSAMDACKGLRIVTNDRFETICSFIISANNNIKRIKLIIERLCAKIGKKIEGTDYYAFPTIDDFKGLNAEFFKSIGAGYRANYLAELYHSYNELVKEDLDCLDTPTLRARLMRLKGVGRKVADCILLFAFNREDVFPVDVWMERVYYENYSPNKLSRDKIATELVNRYGRLAGYAQQYLFYYKTIEQQRGRGIKNKK